MIEIDGEKYNIVQVNKIPGEDRVELVVKHAASGVVEYLLVDGDISDLEADQT